MTKRYSLQINLTILFLVLALLPSTGLAEDSHSISEKIINAVTNDPKLSHFKLEVSDSPYSVIIRGEVPSENEKYKILAIAKEYTGNREIEDQISIKENQFRKIDASDSEITKNIESALSAEGISNKEISVEEGIVTVGGDFHSFKEVDHLFSIVQTIPGVKKINSKATVNAAPYMKEFNGRGEDYNQRSGKE